MPEGDGQGRVTFEMSTGGAVAIDLAESTFEQSWASLRGEPVTLVDKLFFSELGEATLLVPIEICQGHVLTCP